MRRLLITPMVLLVAGLGWSRAPAPSAVAAEAAEGVTLRLVSQSVWNGPHKPLRITVSATNAGSVALTDLALRLDVRAPARSRSVYELSMRSEATVVILAGSAREPGTLQPGATRTFSLTKPLDDLTARNESALYPIEVVLLANDVEMGILRTPMIFLIERPEVPLNLQWTWVLSEPLQFGPDGVFLPGRLESDIGTGGHVSGMAEALDHTRGGPADLVLSPVLIGQLERMAQGYRIQSTDGSVREVPAGQGGAADAARILAAVRRVAARPATELVAEPFGDAMLPALIGSGLRDDIDPLTRRGEAEVHKALDATPVTDVVRPPLSQVNAASLSALTAMGGRILLVDTGFLPTPAGLTFAPQPLVRLRHGSLSALAVTPDEGVATMASLFPDDPLLAARAALGELAAVWLEHPGTPGRGAAILFPELAQYPAPFYGALATAVRSSPWLKRATATQMADRVTADRDEDLPAKRYPTLDGTYVQRLVQTRQVLGRFGATMIGSNRVVARLDEGLLLAEGGTAVADPTLGATFVAHAEQVVQRTYERVQIVPSVVTLTSRVGQVPIRVRNDTPYRARVQVRLVTGPRLSTADGGSKQVTLGSGERTLQFNVRALTTGRFPIKVQILTVTPGTPETIAEAQVIIRSTAYNLVALILTVGAALFLLAWWGRRFLPRRRS